eukprot:TRINITY_DN16773_c0_g1::TRINITY_DN16773_c0_g1_i1::g.11205::m.11205 TRINITY_DN16773_c0_g1::TRINITY_DN16773_c0_g1_i1::g.11205  ORF type:complete len:176 (+),score=23.58,sp/Q64268/HEP2_RAT/28.24/7e-13,Serpin/PF00079.15/5e-29 TRINITY_DN16773_c0_g1_i1:57-530(+)
MENALDIDTLMKISTKCVSELGNRSYDLYMPRFNLETSLAASELLKQMGMQYVFQEGADLSRMIDVAYCQEQELSFSVDHLIHRSFIRVSEQGASRATSPVNLGPSAHSIIGTTAGFRRTMSSRTRFEVNRPFMFMVYHVPSKTSIMLGRVLNPSRV